MLATRVFHLAGPQAKQNNEWDNQQNQAQATCIYGFGEVLMLISVFSSFVVVLLPGGFTTVVLVSFFSDGGLTIVVLLSFFSAGGLTVVVFCSHAANKPNTTNR